VEQRSLRGPTETLARATSQRFPEELTHDLRAAGVAALSALSCDPLADVFELECHASSVALARLNRGRSRERPASGLDAALRRGDRCAGAPVLRTAERPPASSYAYPMRVPRSSPAASPELRSIDFRGAKRSISAKVSAARRRCFILTSTACSRSSSDRTCARAGLARRTSAASIPARSRSARRRSSASRQRSGRALARAPGKGRESATPRSPRIASRSSTLAPTGAASISSRRP